MFNTNFSLLTITLVTGIVTPVELFAQNLATPNQPDMNVHLEPFFTNQWRKKGRGEGKNHWTICRTFCKWDEINFEKISGKWITQMIDDPYVYTKHSPMTNNKWRFCCNSCRVKGKWTWAQAMFTGNNENGQPQFELKSKNDDHICDPPQTTAFLNKVFLNRYVSTK